jgi:succinoglycan biosynthesis transport protein ExoP
MTKQIMTTSNNSMNLPVAPMGWASHSGSIAAPQPGSVIDYWRMLRNRKLLIGTLGLAGLLVGMGAGLLRGPRFRATTTLEIQDVKDDVVAMKILNPLPYTGSADGMSDIQTQVKILQSRMLSQRALGKAQIKSSGELFKVPARWGIWRNLDEVKSENLVDNIAKHLKVATSGQTRIVELSLEAAKPETATRFVNALAGEYIAQNIEARWQMNRQTSEWLGGQLEELRSKLQRSEDALQAYAKVQGLLHTNDNQVVSRQKLGQLQEELTKAQADRIEKGSRFQVARKASPETVPDVLNDSNVRALQTSLADLERKEAELGVTFTPEYSDTKKIRAEIETTEAAISQKRVAIIGRLYNELQESEGREQLLTDAYAKQTKLVMDDSEKSIQYDMLKHEVDTNQQVYESILQRVKESSISSAMKASNVRIIDSANVPEHPYTPSLVSYAGAGLFCGLLMGTLGLAVRARTDGRVKEPGEMALLLGIPELGVIPSVRTLDRRGEGLLSPMKLEPQEWKSYLSSDKLVYPMVADSFRTVLTSIVFGSLQEQPNVLVITSPSPSEGKTTTAINLAVALANMNRRVLLIDGDTCSPRLHDIFGIGNLTGLTELLTRSHVDAKSADLAISKTGVEGLSVLPSGPSVQGGANLLYSKTLPWLISHYGEQYDMVIIDTPPALCMHDARVLGRIAGSVVLVARAARTTRDAIHATFQRFVDDHTPVLGIVLNDWDVKASVYKYYDCSRDAKAIENKQEKTASGASRDPRDSDPVIW